jgi:transcriptional regulator GlxA family with amidase domain
MKERDLDSHGPILTASGPRARGRIAHMNKIPAMHRVAVLAFDGVVAFDLATPLQVFNAVRGYETVVCAAEPHVTAAHGFGIVAPAGLEALASADTVVVPGIADETTPLPEPTLAALRATEARMASICTGSFVLGWAGLLEGRRATTHWRSADEFRRQFPGVHLEPDVLYVDEGDLITSAGVAAGIDLCLHLVRKDLGAEAANRSARRIVVAPHRDGGQAQFIDRPVPAAGGGLEATRAWILARLHEPLTIEQMARHAGYAPRTFARRFRQETGTTPLQWLLAQRVDHARRLLESTDLPVEHVADRAGFGTAVNLREHFRRHVVTTPSAYRRAFSAIDRRPYGERHGLDHARRDVAEPHEDARDLHAALDPFDDPGRAEQSEGR